jgi:hypothetical protein
VVSLVLSPTIPYFLIIGALVAGYLVVVEIVKKGFTEILLTAAGRKLGNKKRGMGKT